MGVRSEQPGLHSPVPPGSSPPAAQAEPFFSKGAASGYLCRRFPGPLPSGLCPQGAGVMGGRVEGCESQTVS